jgi:NTE family protein
MNSRKRVGLALGGGVLRGMAHVGVLSVLEQAGVVVDWVAGTSAGAIAATGYCARIPMQQLEAHAYQLNWLRLARPVWPIRGLISFDGLANWMVKTFGNLEFTDLKIPLVVVTTDIEKGEPVYLHEGPLARAVQASCAVPGFIAPVQLDGRWLCEGAAVHMLPAPILRQMGADYIIAVDVFAPKLRRRWGPLGYLAAGLEIALQNTGGGLQAADCLIQPALAGETYLRFSRRRSLIEAGRQAAQWMLPKIRRDLGMDAADDST